MKYLKTILIVLGVFVIANGAVNNSDIGKYQDDVRSEVRNLSGFDKVDVGGTIVADITAGEDFRVVVEAKEDVLPKLITRIKDDTLIVEFEKDWWKGLRGKYKNSKARVTISLPQLKDLDVSGASRAKVRGINNEKMMIDVSGASNVSIEGSAREITVDLSGASSFSADKLLSEVAEIDLSGASSAKVNVSTELRVEASGASSVRYAGNPRVQKETSGSSSVRGS